MRYTHLPIFKDSYNLSFEVYQRIKEFPREYKYTLGQRLKEKISDFLDDIVKANSLENKLENLESAQLKLECLKIHLRLAFDLKIMGKKSFEFVVRKTEIISKQLSGWISYEKKGQSKLKI